MMFPLPTIIFSKNRAAQLDILLRGMREHCSGVVPDVHILYRTTSPAFECGYAKLREKRILPEIQWHRERMFKADLISILEGFPEKGPVMLLVDDVVFHRPCALDQLLQAFTKRHLFISLRCSRTYGTHVPRFIALTPFLEWRWTFRKPRRTVWNYPFSVDGNIFHAGIVKALAKKLDFKAPNSLEGALHAAKRSLMLWGKSRALGPLQPVLYNNPLNKVQAEGETFHGDQVPEMLNEKYCAGFVIDTVPLYAHVPKSTHDLAPVTFVNK
jgi:hypothetical protein